MPEAPQLQAFWNPDEGVYFAFPPNVHAVDDDVESFDCLNGNDPGHADALFCVSFDASLREGLNFSQSNLEPLSSKNYSACKGGLLHVPVDPD
jgi:hypothetical protein